MSQSITTRQTKTARITRTILTGIRMDLSTYAMVAEASVTKAGRETVTTTTYTLRRIPTDFGIGVEVEKCHQPAQSGVHHVHLDRQLGDSCTCADHIYRSSRCRHLQAVQQAVSRGIV